MNTVKWLRINLCIFTLVAGVSCLKPTVAQGTRDKEKTRGKSITNETVADSGDHGNLKSKSDAVGGAAPESYKIGTEDELQISVWREPELSTPVQVRPDGIITLPLVNDLPVVGLTTKELQNIITEKLKPFVNEPQVTVIVRNIRSRKVHLVGQVGRPGPYPLNDRKTVLQLITEAGGLGQFAKGGSIYIIRTVDGKQTRLSFNYKKALAGKPDSGDIELLPGDMVVVP